MQNDLSRVVRDLIEYSSNGNVLFGTDSSDRQSVESFLSAVAGGSRGADVNTALSDLCLTGAASIFASRGEAKVSPQTLISRLGTTSLGTHLSGVSNLASTIQVNAGNDMIELCQELGRIAFRKQREVITNRVLRNHVMVKFAGNTDSDAVVNTPFSREFVATESLKFTGDGEFMIQCSAGEGVEFTDGSSTYSPNIMYAVEEGAELTISTAGSATIVFSANSYTNGILWKGDLGHERSAATLFLTDDGSRLSNLGAVLDEVQAGDEIEQVLAYMKTQFAATPDKATNFGELVSELVDSVLSNDEVRLRIARWLVSYRALCLLLIRALAQ